MLELTDDTFKRKVSSVTGLALQPNTEHCQDLSKLGAKIIPHEPGRGFKQAVQTLKDAQIDAICLIPPAHRDKLEITLELIEVAKQAGVPNVCLLSSAGCDLAERDRQPRLREFVDIEAQMMATKGDASTSTGHSPVIIRAGFSAENLLLYSKQAQEEGILPLLIGKDHKFGPVALGVFAPHVMTGKGKHGFADKHRGQLMVVTGPMLATGDELATAASKALDTNLKFEDISLFQAKKILKAESTSDEAELEYLLEYYSLVREGKTNYISTTAFHDVTGIHPQEPPEFFNVYAESFHPKHASKKRKVNGK
ncbi:conserved hypothetical protein [Talaromyces stipitatus ATCC 10500]|uniref:NmrA-like domain-containing protein n=1 Tax=Talaromyces stipitatus (strain ATCC 10500 / CBS 375.48 / QM 6759 / NRRL 1006) TaxID=441959 RepID=B8M551_TALSN|nr:uncharacterized protein TSTA_029340 [Talaromyces stipitatus ATCC 10500]EED19657.1 conserved hypothetical protein [Talaromyces stipitatus ATCC 10500]